MMLYRTPSGWLGARCAPMLGGEAEDLLALSSYQLSGIHRLAPPDAHSVRRATPYIKALVFSIDG